MKVTIWNEYRHEIENPAVAKIYPNGIHNAIKDGLAESHFDIKTATLDEAEHGLTEEVLEQTEVLIWWGHKHHIDVSDEIVERVYQRVLNGMGLIVLHSAHGSKIFKKLLGMPCRLRWREADERERLWVVDPAHPIADGIHAYIELPMEEMYGEHFSIPAPDELVFVSWFEGGEVFRSGVTYHRGMGKIFYFRPGHETYPTYYNKDILKVIANGIRWAAPTIALNITYGRVAVPLEEIKPKN